MKKILMVAAEGLPYIKSGGLADVIGSLPKELKAKGQEVYVMLPLYKKIIVRYFNEMKLETQFQLKVAKYDCSVRVFSHVVEGVKTYFIEHAGYFERDGLYGYDDDGERYAFFDHAVFHALKALSLEVDVIHGHDWHVGMLPVLSREIYHFDKTKFVFTIHNLAYQGLFHKDILPACFGLSHELYDNGQLAFYHDMISTLKAAVVYSHKISTVSNSYAREILTEEFGEHMEYVLQLRQHDLWGIVNGIDISLMNPKTDKNLTQTYDMKSLDKKHKNKLALQEKLGLRVSKDVCLIGMVSRLTWQKGVQLILSKMKDIMGLDIQLVILGTGDANYEWDLRNCEEMYKHRMVYYGGYSEEIAQMIYGGADLFLMPSLFEPCGISQLISMRYGTLPIVREVGGLKDTVMPYNHFDGSGTGFTFTHFNDGDMYDCIRRAVYLYYDYPVQFRQLQINAMQSDVSWEKSAQLYLEMYQMA